MEVVYWVVIAADVVDAISTVLVDEVTTANTELVEVELDEAMTTADVVDVVLVEATTTAEVVGVVFGLETEVVVGLVTGVVLDCGVDVGETVLEAVEQSNPMLWIPTEQLLFPTPLPAVWLG